MSSKISYTDYYNIINGAKHTSQSTYHGVNPSTGEELWSAPVSTKADVDEAVAAARKAFKTWRTLGWDERLGYLRKFEEACKEHIPALTQLMIDEVGKPAKDSRGEVMMACSLHFDYFLDLKLPEKEHQAQDRVYRTRYTPLGVVAAILPWNYPIAQVTLKALPALLVGNTVIVKPSPFSPYTALKLVEIANQVLPPGVLQVLGGDARLGPWLVDHPGVDKISFTGSCATGKRVMAAAAKTVKRITLELGGNDAAIVCEDVDVNEVANQVVGAAFSNCGQVCAVTKRVYVHERIYSEFIKAMTAVANATVAGDPSASDTITGPLQNEAQYLKVKDLYKENEDFIPGDKRTIPTNGRGFFLPPVIVDKPPENSRIMMEEQFGPILPVQTWTDEADVLERVNNSTMGLGGSVWSKDKQRAKRIAEHMEAGSIFINSSEKLSHKIPFGGHKQSGLGTEAGETALLAYCNLQVIHQFNS